MLCANLNIYDPALDEVVDQVQIGISDLNTRQVLEHLNNGGSHVNLTIAIPGSDACVDMEWDSSVGAFVTSVEGKPAGLIFYDELKGSLDKALPDSYRACSVCLSSELDIWRRGVIDLSNGSVTTYTATADLSYLGACAYLTDTFSLQGSESLGDQGIDSLHVALERGDAAHGPLKVTRSDLSRLRNQIYGYSPSSDAEPLQPTMAMESLRSLIETLREYPEMPPAQSPRAEKGLG